MLKERFRYFNNVVLVSIAWVYTQTHDVTNLITCLVQSGLKMTDFAIKHREDRKTRW